MGLRHSVGVLREAWRRFVDDDHSVYAGHMAFTLLLSFGPFVVCAILISQAFDPDAAIHVVQMLRSLEDSKLLPAAMADLFVKVIEQVAPKDARFDLSDLWLLLGPAAVGLYAGSSAFEAARNGFNEAYDVKEERNFLWKRFQSLLLAGIIALLFVVCSLGFVAITISFNVIQAVQLQLAQWGMDEQIWSILVLAGVGLFVAALFWMLLMGIHLTLPRGYVKNWHLYVWAQDEIEDRRAVRVPVRPGVRFSVIAWIVFAIAYSSLIGRIVSFESNHGALAGVVATLLFFYISAATIFFAIAYSSLIGRIVSFESNHGALAGVVATLLFFYISAATIFFGAQINIAIATVDDRGRPKWPHPSLKRRTDFDESRQEAFQVLTRSRPQNLLYRLWHYLCGGTVCDDSVWDQTN